MPSHKNGQNQSTRWAVQNRSDVRQTRHHSKTAFGTRQRQNLYTRVLTHFITLYYIIAFVGRSNVELRVLYKM